MNDPALTPGLRLGDRYALVRRLGVGGFGAVWLAQDTGSATPVAVKVLHAALSRAQGVDLARFRREAELLARLDHPAIARWCGHELEGERVFIVVEFIDGLPLDRVLQGVSRRGAPLDAVEVARIFAELAGAITYAHAQGIVHRDLKPANVMITQKGRSLGVKVLDFGIARVAGEAQDGTTVGRVIGSYFYMAPEQIRGERPDARTDVFALGAILFELLTARRAWARDADGQPLAFHVPTGRRAPNDLPAVITRILADARPRPSDVVEGLPLGLDEVVARAMAIEPAARFASVEALVTEARRLLAEGGARTGLTVVAIEPEVRAALLAEVPLSDRAPEVVEPPVERRTAAFAEPLDGLGGGPELGLANSGVAARRQTGSTPSAAQLARRGLEPAASLTPVAESWLAMRSPATPRWRRLAAAVVAVAALTAGAAIVVSRGRWGADESVRPLPSEASATPGPASVREPAAASPGATTGAPPAATSEGTGAPASSAEPTATATSRAREAGAAEPRRVSSAPAPPRPSDPPRTRVTSSPDPESPVLALERELARLRLDGADPTRLTMLADAIRAEALRRPVGPLRTRALRQVEQGLGAADLDVLAAAIASLRREVSP